MAAVELEVRQRIVIQAVLGHRIAHQEHLAADVPVCLQGFLRRGDRSRLQAADLLGVDGLLLWQVQGKRPHLGPQGPAGRRHADPLQANPQAALQAFRNAPGQGAHLLDVVDLTVQHGTLAVLRHFYVQDLDSVPHCFSYHAHYAARADIQGKD